MTKRLTSRSIIFIFIFLLISLGALSLAQQKEDKSKASADKTEKKSDAVDSTFIFTTNDLKGVSRNSNEWIGKQPVVINFWGTWCPPCRLEIPELVKLYPEYKEKGVEIIGLAVPRREQVTDIDKYASQNGMAWQMLLANQEIAIKFKVQSVPTTIFIDKNGKEIERFVGFHNYKELKKAFDKIL
jgi:thiol-disulfide isomerase/thioredoxin